MTCPRPDDERVYGLCTYKAERGSFYCALHGVKWGRGCPPDESCLDDTCCSACPNCCKEGD